MSSLLYTSLKNSTAVKNVSQYTLMNKFKTFYLASVVHERNLLSYVFI